MEKQGILVLGMVFLMGIMFVNLIGAEVNLSDSLANQRYQNILKEFNKTDLVPVIVEVYSPEKVDNLISSFSETDFKDVRKELSPSIFTVKVTKKGLDELVSNSNVKTINLEESSSTVDNQTIGISLNSNWMYCLMGVVLILIILWIIWRIKEKK